MNRRVFDNFFSLCEVSVGPTIITAGLGGCWLGTVKIVGTYKNTLIKSKTQYIAIREFHNVYSEELLNALKYLSIEKSDFDDLITKYYLFEWENSDFEPKPNVISVKNRLGMHKLDL